MQATSARIYPEAASLEGGRLSIGGCDAVALAREFGTPAYVVAEDDLRARAREFTGALAAHHPGPGAVAFASKAFPCTAVLRVFEAEGLWVDVASEGELHLARRAGFPAGRIVVHGNAKSSRELAAALALRDTTLVVDGADEVERLAALVRAGGPHRQRVLLRVTPEVHADTHRAVATGHADQKFGVPLDQAPALLARLEALPGIDLRGLHIHIGSQLFDLAPYREAVGALRGLGSFPAYDLGGGLASAYLPDQDPPSPERWVSEVVSQAHALLGARDAELLLEPGRALVANAGVTLYTVEAVKRARPTWVAVDGGMSDNLRPMLYGSPYTAEVADRIASEEDPGEPCRLAGKHCESGDVIAWDVRLRDPRAGDVVVTPATGAYGHALANNYNGVPRPPVVFAAGGEARLVVRRETVEDLGARDV